MLLCTPCIPSKIQKNPNPKPRVGVATANSFIDRFARDVRNNFDLRAFGGITQTARACSTKDQEWLNLLWESGLSVTLQIRLCPTTRDLCLARNVQSESIKSLGHSSLSDSFVTFASLVKTLGCERVQDGLDLGLHYNGAAYNAAIHKAAGLVGGLLVGPQGLVEKALMRLELMFGRDVVSSEYSKLSKLISIAKGQVQSPKSTLDETVAWLVEMLVLAFQVRLQVPARATETWLDKDRKTGQAGFWHATAMILQVARIS